jgi:DNA polymerase III sliding clamp (beta) subunit (PCNA family)
VRLHGWPFSFLNQTQKRITMKNIIELPVIELRQALPGLGKIIGRRTTLPVLSAVKVARDKAGIITLQGTDLDSTATFTFKDKSEGPAAQLLVPFERLQKAVKQSNGRIELSLTSKDEVIIRTFWRDTPMEEKVHVPYNDDWPKAPVVEGEPVKLSEQFRSTWQEAMECSSTDESRPVINSVYLDVDDKKGHYVIATNGRHLFAANSFAFDLKKSLVIPTRKFLGWSGWWTEGEATVAIKPPVKPIDPTWLQFAAGPWTLLTKGTEQPYPNWKNAVPADDFKTTIIIPERAIASVLQVLARLPGEDDFNKGVTLNASRNTFVLSGRNKDQAQPISVPIVEAQIKGVPGVVTINRDYLTRALRFGLNQIDILDELSPVVLRTKGKKMIVMPIHPGGAAPAKVPATTKAQSTTATTTTPAEPTQPAQHEERTTMPRQTTVALVNGEQQDSPLKQLIQQIENIKETLKGVVGELNTALEVVKRAEKEKRGTEKEMAAIRDKVREIQSFSI